VRKVGLGLAVCLLAASCQWLHPATGPSVLRFDGHGRGEVVLFHGLRHPIEEFVRTEPYRTLIRRLTADGWDVTVPELPERGSDVTGLRAAISEDGYVEDFLATYRSLPATERRVVVGISWGGMHALEVACRDHTLTGWAALIPAVDPRDVTEFADVAPAASLDLAACGAPRTPGVIEYGHSDDRAPWSSAAHLARLWGVPDRGYRGGHEVSGPMVDDLLTFLDGLP